MKPPWMNTGFFLFHLLCLRRNAGCFPWSIFTRNSGKRASPFKTVKTALLLKRFIMPVGAVLIFATGFNCPRDGGGRLWSRLPRKGMYRLGFSLAIKKITDRPSVARPSSQKTRRFPFPPHEGIGFTGTDEYLIM